LINRNTLTRKEDITREDVLTIKAGSCFLSAGRVTTSFGSIPGKALRVRAGGDGGMARRQAALALFGASV
jgi:hypothetical protein